MDWLLTRLNILADGLEKKEHALREIVNITENQSTVLQSDLSETEAHAFIVQMNREKQQFIKQVIQCDNMFESILKEAGPALDAAQESYKPQVAELQTRIRRVMDLDVKIRVYEEKNNALMKGKQAPQSNPLPPEAVITPAASAPMTSAPVSPAGTAAINPSAPSATVPPKQKTPPLPPDANRVINAYVKNTRNYKGPT